MKKVFKGRRRVVVARKARRAYNKGNQILHIKKTVLEDRINVPANATLFSADTFEFGDLPAAQVAAYKGLYEEFKIKKVVVKFNSLINMASAVYQPAAVPFVSLGMIHTTVDTNDNTTPTSIQDMMNDSSYRGSRSNVNHTRVIYPKFLNVVAGAVQAQSANGWLKTENDNVSHYGLKIAFEGGSGSNNNTSFIVEPIITYYMCFRNPK